MSGNKGELNTAAVSFLNDLSEGWQLLSLKLYRVELPDTFDVPKIPCLDHEAMLHQRIAPHFTAYVADRQTGDLLEVIFEPQSKKTVIDLVSTAGEHCPKSLLKLQKFLDERDGKVCIEKESWIRGDRRVMAACRAQVSLRDVLLKDDLASLNRAIDRLRTIAGLMEKESRVASWSVRTITGPILAAVGVIAHVILKKFGPALGGWQTEVLRYALLTMLGGFFLYLGLKAVHLTKMANRMWKRSAEYGLITAERAVGARRKPQGGPAEPTTDLIEDNSSL